MSINDLYKVYIGAYAEDHFIKSFSKTYKNARDVTLRAIQGVTARIEAYLQTTKAEKIHSCRSCHIVKCEFAVAGTQESPHGSGNRYIVHMDQENHECHILLVYAKTDVKGSNETNRRRGEIRKNYSSLTGKFTGI
ncbi:MAG: hypothetical protein WC606_05470 [Candidatus Absconditabacterales bacterium]